ncbi:MAG: ATP-binding protein [Gemmatimonadaceae bacterium]
MRAQRVHLTTEQDRLTDDVRELRRELESRTRELERSQARFRDVIERNADAIVVVDEKGVVRLVNDAATKLFGASREQLLGSPFGFPLVADETTELDLVRNGEARVAEMRVVESEWEGETACIASLRDITERKRAEQDARELIREYAARAAAEEAARRLRFLLESSTVLASSLDHRETLSALARLCVSEIADWAVVYSVDEAGVPGRLEVAHREVGKEELLRELQQTPIDPNGPHPVLEVVRARKPILAEAVTDAFLESVTRDARHRKIVSELGVASFMMVPIIARDRVLGAISLVSSRSSRQFDEHDLALAEDIAARAALAIANARLYEEARRANKTKSDFLAVVSHDLRTPLTAIIGYVDLMEMGVPNQLPDATRERLRRIRTSATHLLYLLNELLIFARLDSGREELRRSDVDLRDVARDAAAVGEPLALERGLRFHLDLPEHPVILRTDPNKVRQVLLNLIGNAVKYTRQGEIRVELREPAERLATFRVRDTGVGIAEQHVQQIFEPFWQVDPNQRARDGGTGLGLSVVRRLVQLLGGEVCVESELGRGSTFTVTLPSR